MRAPSALVVTIVGCGRIGFDVLPTDGPSSSPSGAGGREAVGGTTVGSGGASSGTGGRDGGVLGGFGGSAAGRDGGGAGGEGAAGGGAGGGPSGRDAGGGTSGVGGFGGGGAPPSDGGAYQCSPGAAELCDGRDNDCDLAVDESACPVSCEGFASSTSGYMLCDGNYKWDDAKAACEAAGLVFVAIESQAENDFIAAFAFANRTRDVWLGGSDLANEGDWRWVDDTPFWMGLASPAGSAVGGAYASFRPDQPDGLDNGGGDADCLSIQQSGRWVDQGCHYFLRALCETP